MWKLALPAVADARQELRTALAYADGAPVVHSLTPTEEDAVAAVYAAYDALGGQPSPGLANPVLDRSCLQAIERGYDEVQKKGRLARLRGRLMAGVDHCPSCAMERATQLDHSLPKSRYPVLAIYARNLVPCCGPCNNAKRAHDPAGGDRLVHAYFTPLPAVTFLVATVTMIADALEVRFAIDSTQVDAESAAALNFQLTRLDLNERLEKAVNNFLFEQRMGVEEVAGLGDAGLLRDFLLASAKAQRTSFGLNDWRPALLTGLAACENFLNGGAERYFGRPRHVGA